ncbi:nuclear transport factor 2 family protein [Wenjunlia tyrosinilytica]|jgi:ketosteroid isomerase-like protein|nr:nuclear transport factor 2 family protein [Wenjunlia tyrosinilytica]
MAEHPDCALVRRGYELFNKGDMETLATMMTRDCAHHVPGSNPLSGHHKGIDNVMALYRRMGEMTQGNMRGELEGLFADGRGHVMSVHRNVAERDGRGYNQRGGIFFTIVGGKISDLDECVEDIDLEDEFWS